MNLNFAATAVQAWLADFENAVRALDQLRSKSLATFDDTCITPDTIKSGADFLNDVATMLSKPETAGSQGQLTGAEPELRPLNF